MRQVIVISGDQNLECDFHVAGFRINLDEGNRALEVLFVGIDRDIALGDRHAETRRSNDILSIHGHERRGVVTARVGDFDDLSRFKGFQIDAGNTGRIVGIDEQPAPVRYAVGLRQLRVVGIIPGLEIIRGHEHGFRFLRIAPAVFRELGENRNGFQQTPGGQTMHCNVAAEASRHESVKLIVITGSNIDLGCRITATDDA